MEMNKTEVGARGVVRPRKFWNTARKDAAIGWLFLAPEFLGMLVLGVFPIVFSLYLSLCDWNLVGGL
ncbi:hypothetical protein SK3146_01768 [Paenibacillus konkukensis]|uniref:Sugar ABC transporter permease n=2 Tax=Paenibacillus konkukensis TaxID=2020716 RepID=A0ABY4RKS6_9BACL|nr:hypothetical protein SK3146_01768 [Paenibacillus konkukensis]